MIAITEEEARSAAARLDASERNRQDYCEWLNDMLTTSAWGRQELARLDSEKPERVNYWLAERNQYGIADVFVDGPHSDREGVEKALYLINSLGLNRSTKNRDLCCVRVEQTPVEPKNHNANEEAVAACREMMK